MTSEARDSESRLRVFISYSRQDSEFAQDLRNRLIEAEFDAYLDVHDIVPGEPWRERLHGLIEAADAIVFMISTGSVSSAICSWEINEAELLGKRILPVVCRQTPTELVPQRLQRLNYVFMETEAKSASEFPKLCAALEENTFWVREHTRLGELAGRWERAGRPARLLLRGSDIADAEGWRAVRPPTGPEISGLQNDYLAASRRGETNRQRWWLGGTTAVAAVTTALSAAAVFQYFVAEQNATRAEREAETATLQREAALVDTEVGERPREALKRALAAAKRYQAKRAADEVPKIAEVHASLFEALAAARERPRIRGYMHGSYGDVVAIRPLPGAQGEPLQRLVATRDVVVVTDEAGRVVAPLVGAPDLSFGFINDVLRLGAIRAFGFAVASGTLIEGKAHNTGVRFYDAENALVREVLTDHPWPMFALAHLPSGKAIVAGDSEGNLFRIDLTTYEVRKVHDGHGRAVTGLARVGYDPGTLLVAFGSVHDRSVRAEQEANQTDALTPAIDKATSAQIVARLGEDPKMSVYALGTGATSGTTCLEAPASVRSSSLSAAWLVVSCDSTGGANVWMQSYSNDPWPPVQLSVRLSTEGGAPTAVAISDEEDLIAVADARGTIRVWSKRGQPLTPPLHHVGGVEALAFEDGGRVLVSAGSLTLRRWDIADVLGDPERDYPGYNRPSTHRLQVAARGRVRLATNFDNAKSDTVHVLTAKTMPVRKGTPIDQRDFTFERVETEAVQMALSDDGSRAVWSTGTQLYFHNTADDAEPARLPLPAGDHATAITLCEDATCVLVATHRADRPKDKSPTSAPRVLFFGWPKDGAPELITQREGAHVAVITSAAAVSTPGALKPKLARASSPRAVPRKDADPPPVAAFTTGDGKGRISLWSRQGERLHQTPPQVDEQGRHLQVAAIAARPEHAEFVVAFDLPESNVMTQSAREAAGILLQSWSVSGVPLTTRLRLPRALTSAVFDASGTLLVVAGTLRRDGSGYPMLDFSIIDPETLRLLDTINIPAKDGDCKAVWFDAEGRITTVDGSWQERTWTARLGNLIEIAERRLAAWDVEDRYIKLFTAAESAQSEGRSAIARETYAAAGSLRDDVAQPWIIIGRSIYNPAIGRGDKAAAKQALDKALAVNPHNIIALLHRGRISYGEEDYAEAEHYFSRAADAPMTFLVVPEVVATFLKFNIQVRNMAISLRRQARYEPEAFLAYTIFGQERWDDAVSHLTQLIDRYGGAAKDYETRAYAYAYLGRYTEAARDGAQAISLLAGEKPSYSGLDFFANAMQPVDFAAKHCSLTAKILSWHAKAESTSGEGSAARSLDELTRAVHACRAAKDEPAMAEHVAAVTAAWSAMGGDDGSVSALPARTPALIWKTLLANAKPGPIADFAEEHSAAVEAAHAGRWLAAHEAGALEGPSPAPEVVAGFWRSPDRKWVVEIRGQADGQYVWHDRNPETARADAGEPTAEMRATPKEGGPAWQFVGRHVWRGGKDEDVEWGRQGGLVAQLIDEDTLFIAYLDSRYRAGWTLKRFAP